MVESIKVIGCEESLSVESTSMKLVLVESPEVSANPAFIEKVEIPAVSANPAVVANVEIPDVNANPEFIANVEIPDVNANPEFIANVEIMSFGLGMFFCYEKNPPRRRNPTEFPTAETIYPTCTNTMDEK